MLQLPFSCEFAKKHIRNFENPVWNSADREVYHPLVELVTGTKLFFSYLCVKMDRSGSRYNVPRVLDRMPKTIADDEKFFVLSGRY